MNNNSSPNEIQRKDLLSALSIWLVAEFVAFVLFPSLDVIKPAKGELHRWFLTSLPLGLGGVIFLSFTSRFIALARERQDTNGKDVIALLSQLGGFIAMLGLIYPLLVAMGKFFS